MTARAGVRETVFFEIFGTEQECLRAAFEEALQRLTQTVDGAVSRESCWLDRLRAGVVSFLGFLDDEPAWGRLLILGGPVTDGIAGLRREQRLLGVLTQLIDSGESRAPGELLPNPALTAEFVVGGAVSVVRAQMLKRGETVLVGLAPSLMSFMVRPYLGQVAASTELEGRPSASEGECDVGPAPSRKAELARAASLPIRVTYRTTMVLRAIAGAPYSNNREIADAAGLTDEGQTSKLLARLERQGVIENVGVGAARGEPNAWLLTASGQRALTVIGGSADPRPRGTRVRGEA